MPQVQNPNDKRRESRTVSSSQTLTDVQSGYVQNVTVDGVAVTLPAAAAGKTVVLRVGGGAPTGAPIGAVTNKAVGFTVVGSVTGLGATGALSIAKANANHGDEVTLTAGAATWYLSRVIGTGWVVA